MPSQLATVVDLIVGMASPQQTIKHLRGDTSLTEGTPNSLAAGNT